MIKTPALYRLSCSDSSNTIFFSLQHCLFNTFSLDSGSFWHRHRGGFLIRLGGVPVTNLILHYMQLRFTSNEVQYRSVHRRSCFCFMVIWGRHLTGSPHICNTTRVKLEFGNFYIHPSCNYMQMSKEGSWKKNLIGAMCERLVTEQALRLLKVSCLIYTHTHISEGWKEVTSSPVCSYIRRQTRFYSNHLGY